jgi:hypothetical protein
MSDAPKQIQFTSEVDSSGPMPHSKTFQNNPNTFPELRESLDLLLEQARVWGVLFPLFERIVLHRTVYDHPKYLITVEVPGIDAPSKDEGLWLIKEKWQPDSLRALVEKDFRTVFEDPEEWMIEMIEPEDEVIDVVEGSCWLLYERTSGTVEAGDSETGTSKQLQVQKDKLAVREKALNLLADSPDMTLIELATVAHQETRFGCYGTRTIEGWIRPVHPQYTPGKPGRKPKK